MLGGHKVTDYAVILTHNRPDMLKELVHSLCDQVDWISIVDNASSPPVEAFNRDNVGIFYEPTQPPNIAKMWNDQLNMISGAEKLANGEGALWNVALLCDDCKVPAGWYRSVAEAMRRHGASAASTHSYAPAPDEYVLTRLSNGPDRMCPWAFMLPGDEQLRADEMLRWWYCDTDLDWQARRRGGTLVTTGDPVENLLIGDFTARIPELGWQAQQDGDAFWAKWRSLVS